MDKLIIRETHQSSLCNIYHSLRSFHELVYDFFEGFARGARANVHARVLYGRSNHHKIESLFKAFARALRAACWRDRRMARLLPSTKGLL